MRSPLVFASLLGLSTVASSASAATFYAAPGGTGTTCSEGSPCPASTAAGRAQAGDTVYLRGGTYSGTLRPAHSGTSSAWITFAAYPGELPVFDGGGSGGTAVGSDSQQYLRFIGLVARNYSATGFGNGWTNGDCNPASNGNIQFVNCIADGNGINGVAFYCASGVLLEQSIVAHNGNRQPSWSSGVNLFGVTGGAAANIVRQTVSFENVDISGAASDGSGFILDQNSTGATFVNNVGFGNGGSCIRLTNSSGAQIINNTCVRNGLDPNVQYHDEIFFSDGMSRTNALLRNNLAIPTTGQRGLANGGTVLDENNIWSGTDSLVASASGVLDFHLAVGATGAIDQGTAVGTPSEDIGFDWRCIRAQSGQSLAWWQHGIDYGYIEAIGGVAACFNPGARQGAPDIGAHEFGHGSSECAEDAECDDANACTSDRCVAGHCTSTTQSDCCTPTTYQAEAMYQSTGNASADGWNLFANGYISTEHPFNGGPSRLRVVARGEVADGIWPHMVVSVDGAVVGEVSVASSVFAEYIFEFGAPLGIREVSIAFDNDLLTDTEDRNLHVDQVTVDCVDDCVDTIDCDDGNACTSDVCAANGACQHDAIPGCCVASSDCNDGDACTQESCTAGVCVVTPVGDCCLDSADCADDDPCTDDACDLVTHSCAAWPVSGCCSSHADCADDTQCTDDTCDLTTHACRHVAVAGCCSVDDDCNDGDACTVDACDVPSQTCAFEAIAQCCLVDGDCGDGNVCTSDACDSSTQRCGVTPVVGCCLSGADCVDGDACTADVCDLASHTCLNDVIAGCCADDTDCDDGNSCTVDTCAGGACRHAGVDGCCRGDADCDDGNACTIDTCGGGTCSSATVANCCVGNSECDDGDPCTLDQCHQGSHRCTSSEIGGCCRGDDDCDDGDSCTVDTCNLTSHQCDTVELPGCCTRDAECDDGNDCTVNTCVPATGRCATAAVTGCCATAVDCNDGDPCTSDTCNAANGECQFAEVSACCRGDGDCHDGDACTTDSCGPLALCSNVAVLDCCLDDGDCNDADPCTTDVCDRGVNVCRFLPTTCGRGGSGATGGGSAGEATAGEGGRESGGNDEAGGDATGSGGVRAEAGTPAVGAATGAQASGGWATGGVATGGAITVGDVTGGVATGGAPPAVAPASGGDDAGEDTASAGGDDPGCACASAGSGSHFPTGWLLALGLVLSVGGRRGRSCRSPWGRARRRDAHPPTA